jgi:predicted unusual protein kinase regulating ubiquinone biosynthesis (AarF/ABC1/UbiB family)
MTEEKEEAPLSSLARGFRKRTWVTTRLASKVGLKALAKTLSLRERVNAVDEEAAVAAAERLLAELGGLKGLIMKLGQMASYLQGSLPPKAQRILSRLQAESQPMAYGRVAEVIREELGHGPGELFDRFDERPFAAASIGQVHRAVWRGREVAVKVQYPGVEEALRSDLKTVGRLLKVSLFFTAMDAQGLLAELREHLLEECDYLAEADHQELFRRLWATSADVAVPAVVRERSSRRVLTSELARGLGFYPFLDQASQGERDRAGAVIFRNCFQSIFRHHVYNADPHPGNYLFAPEGKVVFLDFGCIKRFETLFIDRWRRLALTVLDDRRGDFPDALIETGMVARPRKFDYDYQWKVMRHLYEPFLSPERVAFTHAHVSRSYDLLMFQNPNRFRTVIPPDWLFVNRLQWGLYSVLAHLQARARWGDLFREALEPESVPEADRACG